MTPAFVNRIRPLIVGLLLLALGASNSSAAQLCSLRVDAIPEQCKRFERSCPVLQSCVMDWVLRNEDIADFDIGTLALQPLDERAGSPDENTVYAEPAKPVVIEQSPIIPQACREDVMQAVTENFAAKRSLPFAGAEQRIQKHMRKMHKEWSEKGWSLEPTEVFAHLHHCRDVCGDMIARLAQCHIWAVSNAPLKSLVTFDVNRYRPEAIREAYPFSLGHFARSVVDNNESRRRPYHVAVIGRASRDGSAEHNYDLSYKRAHTVRAMLIERGLPSDSVRLIWLGEQPPQIHPAMVEGYELSAFYKTLGPQRALRVNRSVLVVAYPVDESVEVGVAHAH